MIVRWRRLAHLPALRSPQTLANPRLLHSSQDPHPDLNLCSQLIDSTVSNCPSDTIALSFFLWCARWPGYFHHPDSFNRMVPVVRRLVDRFKTVEEIVGELESIGSPKKAQTFLVLLRICWRGGMYDHALEVFDVMRSQNYVPNTFMRNIVLDILFRAGEFEAGMRFFWETPIPNFITFNIVLGNLCKAGDWWGVRVVLREMVQKGFQLNDGTYLMALDCFCKTGRMAESLQLLGSMVVSSKRPSVAVWTILIDGLCRIGKIDVAGEFVGKMARYGCPPNVFTYSCIIKKYVESQMFDRVSGLLDAMSASGCVPDLVFFNIMINSFCKVRRYDGAIKAFLCLCSRNIKPDSYTLSSLITLCCSSGKMSLFPELVRGLDVSVDLVACNSLLCFFCKAGFPSLAVDFYGDMVDWGFTPDRFTFAVLLDSLCRLGRVDQAVNFYGEIVAKNPKCDAYIHTVILSALVREGKYNRAIRLFKAARLEDFCLDVVSYTVAIHGLLKGGRFEEARSLFDQMKQFGVLPNTCTYNVMLSGLSEVRDVTAIRQLLRDMKIAGIELDCISFNKIIGLLIRVHRVHSAFRVYIVMCNLGLKPNWTTYSLLLQGFVHACEGELYYICKYLEESNLVYEAGRDLCDEPLQCYGTG